MSETTNPYQAPVAPETNEPMPEKADILAFANETSPEDYYAKQWITESGTPRFKPNFAVAFVGANWLFFRKQYLAAFVFLAAEFALSFAIGYLFPEKYWSGFLAIPLLRTPLIFVANRLYLHSARQTIARCPHPQTDPEPRAAWLQKRGGTSMVGVIANIVGTMILNSGITMLPMIAK
ncbi:MAG: hypothetical protein JNM27_21830 [Leptospirales bacterium]|nr:hypothetical protein [Leptospirales bacterium]